MASILATVALALAEFLNGAVLKPDRIGSIDIRGNEWTDDSPIRDAADLYPGMLLPDEATLLRAELRLLMRFHDRFDLDASMRPTLRVLPREDGSRFRNVEINFPESKPKPAMPDKKQPVFAGPKATYLTYLEAIRRGNLSEAKKCWVANDNDKSGALDVIVGIWISFRRMNQVAIAQFGEAGSQAIPDGWRRDDITDKALRLTQNRLADAKVEIRDETAMLRFRWMHSDRGAFMEGVSAIHFRKVDGTWKIDANEGSTDRADVLAPGSWGPMIRDQIVIMNEAIDGIERGKLKTATELAAFVESKMAAMINKYEEQRSRMAPKDK